MKNKNQKSEMNTKEKIGFSDFCNNAKSVLFSIYALKLAVAILFLMLFYVNFVFAVPQTLNVQGRLVNLTGQPQSGIQTMTFNIYNSYTGGSPIYSLGPISVVVDNVGAYSVVLNNVNLDFSEQYYLGITVSPDSEMTPRVNFTTSPYSFRANVSDYLDSSRDYSVKNLFVIDSLGVGTNYPYSALDVVGNLTLNESSLKNCQSFNRVLSTDVFGRVVCIPISSSDGGGWTNTTTVTSTSLNVNLTAGNLTIVAGNLGVGTINPSTRLEVAGNITINENTVKGCILSGGVLSTDSNGRIVCVSDQTGTPDGTGGWTNTTTVTSTSLNVNLTAGNLTIVDGNVAIGSLFASDRLYVNGTFSVQNATGVQGLYQDNRGYVGIGTTNPNSKLDVIGDSGIAIRSSDGNTNNFLLPGSSGLAIRDGTNQIIMQFVNGQANVGIGTTVPKNKLHVNGTNGGYAGIYIDDAVPSDSSFTLYNDAGTLKWNGNALATGSSVSGTTGYIARFSGTDSVGNSVIYQDSSGKVGISTTTPTSKLSVVGDMNVTEGAVISNTTISGATINSTYGNVTITSKGGSVIIRLG